MTLVAEHLTASRNAHKNYRRASGVIDAKGKITTPADYAAAREAVQQARDARQAAHDLDPTHMDPAWALELSATHGDLMAFYEKYLATP